MNTDDYRNAPSGIGPLAAEWKDKPHRLIYDLCGEVERLRASVAEFERLQQVWLMSPEAAKRLDGYRELGERCAALERERDEALAEVEKARALICLTAIGCGECDLCRKTLEVERLKKERVQFAENIAADAMRRFIGLARPDEPFGAADWSRGESCIRAALSGKKDT